MNETELLMEKASTSVSSAKLLLGDGFFDYTVSRSYYAMFYAAEAILLTKELKFSSHRSVISLFGEHFVKTGTFQPIFGKRLSEAFKNRLVGDYSYTSKIDEETAKDTLDWAEEFVEEIDNYLKKHQ